MSVAGELFTPGPHTGHLNATCIGKSTVITPFVSSGSGGLSVLLMLMAAICLVFTIILKTRANDSARLNEPRASILTIGVQIICGDCCGDDPRPIKTHLGRTGNCAQCGGRSYMLASRRAGAGTRNLEIPQPTAKQASKSIVNGLTSGSGGHRRMIPIGARNPWIASSKLLNEERHQNAFLMCGFRCSGRNSIPTP